MKQTGLKLKPEEISHMQRFSFDDESRSADPEDSAANDKFDYELANQRMDDDGGFIPPDPNLVESDS
jgi:hypothetical protein